MRIEFSSRYLSTLLTYIFIGVHGSCLLMFIALHFLDKANIIFKVRNNTILI
jgi:hypothetical protein